MENEVKYVSEIIENRISKVALRQDGILHIDILKEEHFDVKDYDDLMESAKRIGKGLRFLNLITVGNYTLADSNARKKSTCLEGSLYKMADAFVIESMSQKIVANFYMKVNRPIVPTQFFTSQTEALKWLKSHI